MRAKRFRLVQRILIGVLFLEIVIASLAAGARLRFAAWDYFEPVRHSMDVSNGWGWGQRALRYGFFNLYDHVVADRGDGEYSLDYTPLRLGVMTGWARWTNRQFPGNSEWRGDYGFNSPLLFLNMGMEGVSAIGIFLLVRRWKLVGRAGQAQRLKKGYDGLWHGLFAAVLFWVNPALIIDGHAWPQWDVWPVPFFVFALLAATCERWVVAGILLGVGVMFKGQLMLVAPLFVLWPLFMNAPRAALRVVIGFGSAVAVIASPWLIGHGALWVAGVVLVPIIVRRNWYRGRPLAAAWITVPIAVELMLWPLILSGNRGWMAMALVVALAIVLIVGARRMSDGWVWCQMIFALACGLFLCPMLFDGSMAWYKIGFAYGAGKFQEMTIGAENLAAILERYFGVQAKDGVFTINLPAFSVHHLVSVQQLLGAIYGVTLIVAAAAAAVHWQRRDPRFLVAVVMPWMMFFALLTHMHERYLVWAACLSALWTAAGAGMTILHLVISGLAFLMIAQTLVMKRVDVYPGMAGVIKAAWGGMAWMVLLVAGVVLFQALVVWRTEPSRKDSVR